MNHFKSEVNTKTFKDYNILDMSLESWTQHVDECLNANSTKPNFFVCLNPHSYVVAETDCKFKDALLEANWILPDGIGIMLGSRLIRQGLRQRITGLEAFFAIMKNASEKERRVFFIGGSEECIQNILYNARVDFPGLAAVDGMSPPYCDEFDKTENDAIVSRINDFSPDIIWVGLTAPKQEKWIFNNLSRLPNAFVGPIGAVFDYYAGTTKLAPKYVRKIGLEWFFRLLTEPRRVWKRTLISLPIFLFHIFFSK